MNACPFNLSMPSYQRTVIGGVKHGLTGTSRMTGLCDTGDNKLMKENTS
jgi:hypothetical protein